MRVSKFTYLLIHLILATNFWNITIFQTFFNRDIVFLLTILWSFLAIYIQTDSIRLKALCSFKYNKYFFIIIIGVFISMFNADFFWEQNIKTTFIAQRFIYMFVALPAILYIQPTYVDIKRVLQIASVVTLVTWVITIFNPTFLAIKAETIEMRASDSNNIGYNVPGVQFTVFYIYILIQDYIRKFSIQKFLIAMSWVLFIVLYQNRSLLIGVILAVLYSFFKFRSKHKVLMIVIVVGVFLFGIIYTSNIWADLMEETQAQLNDKDYNRWKALDYFFNEHSPNGWCYVFGNGMPSGGNSSFGNLFWENMRKGIYGSDVGMIGMWSDYGILSIAGIYYIIAKVISNSHFPLMLKFMCFHVLAVPTIFHFWSNPGILLFVLIIYLYAYFDEYKKIRESRKIKSCNKNVGSYNSQL